jgi:beta-lactamase regulating signal transducer with metallopeptidase domain
MTVLLNIALINAFTVVPLALLAWLVGRTAKRPALTHALWVLVLVKFVTPPLFNLPFTIELPAPVEQSTDAGMRAVGADVASNDRTRAQAAKPITGSQASPLQSTAFDPKPVVPEHGANASTDSVASSQPVVASHNREANQKTSTPTFTARVCQSCSILWAKRPELPSMLLICWLGGVVGWTGWQLFLMVRFHRRVLTDAIEVDELQEQTVQLARRMGLSSAPQVRIINATVSPMLWGCGSRAVLLFPADLAERLDDESRATLLAHELAHYSRGDHWVRLLELFVTGMFWWHPVAWWARRQIEEAEEECCDAWVIGEFPHAPRRYAEALLDTIDFLCEAPVHLPPVASGLGQSHFLRHRLTKIVRGVSPKSLSARNRWSLALVAALLLPLHPFALGSSSLRHSVIDSARPIIAESPVIVPLKDTETIEAASAAPSEVPLEPQSGGGAPGDVLAPRSGLPRRPGEQTWANAVSPDGRFVVRTTTSRRVVLSDRTNSTETDLSDERIAAVAFSPDGDWFASASLDGTVAIWDSARAKKLRTLLTHGDALRTVAVSPNGGAVASGSRDGTVLVNDARTGQSLIEMPGYSSAVNCVRFSPGGNQLAAAVGDWQSNHRGKVVLLDLETGQTTATLECATSPGALAFASDDELIVGHWDGLTQLWNLATRKVIGSAMANKNVVAAAAFSPDNPVLREVTFGFVNQDSRPNDESSPLSLLRGLFASPEAADE